MFSFKDVSSYCQEKKFANRIRESAVEQLSGDRAVPIHTEVLADYRKVKPIYLIYIGII